MDLKPMKMTDTPITDAELYINDPDWVMEQKMDGARALVSWDYSRETFTWQASGGGPLKFAAAVQHIAAIEAELLDLFKRNDVEEIVLDGELMIEDGTLRVFDIPVLIGGARGDVTPMKPLAYRITERDHLFEFETGERVSAVRTAWDLDQKREMWATINEAGVEGAMVKHLGSTYLSGVRTKQQLKLKLVKTADVVVMEISNWTSTTGSAALAVKIDMKDDPQPFVNGRGKRAGESELPTTQRAFNTAGWRMEPREWLPIGNSSLIGKDRSIEVGSVVEINYLYWTGQAVIQPRIMRKRLAEEKTAEQCTVDQFPFYSRRAV